MTGDALPGDDHVSRDCKPSAVGATGLPMAAAFELRSKEGYLSVNWLEYFEARDFEAAADCVRSTFLEKGSRSRPNGTFAVLNVGSIDTVAKDTLIGLPRIKHLPVDDGKSHSGVFGNSADSQMVVTLAL